MPPWRFDASLKGIAKKPALCFLHAALHPTIRQRLARRVGFGPSASKLAVMSDNWLQYVPKDPSFRPSSEAAERAQRLLSALLPDSDSVESRFEERVSFFHPGANWSGVRCAACGADAEPWWGDAMDRACESGFRNLICMAPCCGACVSLNGLRYLWPAAFGSYVIEATNPNSVGLTPSQLHQLQGVLGCELVEIPLHL